MCAIERVPKLLKGLSFEVADLILLNSWAKAGRLRMVVRLDHGSDFEEYEEVLAFHVGTSRMWRWLMWRNANSVFVRSAVGRAQRYPSVAKAVEALDRKQRVKLTDTKAEQWPCQTVIAAARGSHSPPPRRSPRARP